MTAEEIFSTLREKFGDAVLETDGEAADPSATVSAASIAEIGMFLKSDPGLRFTSLMCLSGVERDEENMGVVYHLYSIEKKHKITLQVIVPKSAPRVASVARVWRTADWHEREAYDLLGIVFDGHPDFRRILLPDDWEGHPLRSDYAVPETYRGMPVPYPEEGQTST